MFDSTNINIMYIEMNIDLLYRNNIFIVYNYIFILLFISFTVFMADFM